MKSLILVTLTLTLAACSAPVQQSSVPMDMKTVEEYRQRVATGNTVSVTQPQDEELNQSDKRTKVKVYHHYPHPRIRPSIGYHYGGYHHSELGIGLGYY